MDAVVGVRGAIQVPVPVILGVLLLPLLRHHVRVAGVGEHLFEEVDVAGVMHRVELVGRRVGENHHAPLAHERLAAVLIEEVAEARAHDEDRVHDRVHVVGADVGDAHGEDVGLALDLDELLVVHVLRRDLVDGLDLAALDAGHLVRRFDAVEDLAGGPCRQPRHRLGGAEIERPILGVPLPLPLRQELERLREHVGVQRGLDLEHLGPVIAHHLAHAPCALVKLGGVLVHERVRRLHRGRVVVMAQRAVAGEADGGRLPAAVHGDEVDVDVDEQVGLGGSLVDLDLFALVGRSEEGEVVRILGIVLVQQSTRLEGVVDPIAEGVAQFEFVHPPVQCERSDDVDVVDAGVGGHREHLLDDPLAQVGPAHLRQWQRHVVERDRELHAGEQQRWQRVHVDRVEQRRADGAVDVVDGVVRFRCVDHP